MEKFELDPRLREEIRARVLGEGFMKIVQSVRRGGKTFRIYMRPVEIGGERKFQAEMTDDAGVYLPTGPGDAQRMELLNMPGDGSDVWLDVRAVQLYLQISLTSIYKLIHTGEIPAVKLGTKTIRVNRRALEEYLQRAVVVGETAAA